mgnify:CR=1 FL=1
MKKIYCEVAPRDYIEVKADFEGVDINVVYEDSTQGVYITGDKIRKLRKQLKRALIEIEGLPGESL